MLYPFYGIGDLDETRKSGKHKGENRYWRNIKKYFVPFYGQIEQLINMDTDMGVFNALNKNSMQK